MRSVLYGGLVRSFCYKIRCGGVLKVECYCFQVVWGDFLLLVTWECEREVVTKTSVTKCALF